MVVLCATILVRSIWTFPVVDGDALTKYFIAAEIHRTGDWSLLLYNHHTLRWVEMVPQVWLTMAAGIRFELFYVLPLLTWSLGFLVILLAVRRHLGTGALLLLAALMFCDPLSFRLSSQLLNPPFGVLFVAMGCWLLSTVGLRRYAAVAGSAGLFFLAYGAHVTYIGFAAGAALWLAIGERQPAKAALFSATLLALFLAETLAFNALSGGQLALGRLEGLVTTPHMNRALEQFETTSFIGLLERWRLMPLYNGALSFGFFGAVAWWLARRSVCRVPRIVMCFGAAALAYGVLLTFAVSSLDPVKPLVILRPRYLSPFFPFAAVVGVFALSELAGRWVPRRERLLAVIALALAAVLVAAPAAYNRPPDSLVLIRPLAFAWRAQAEYARFTDRFMAGDLVLDVRPHAYKLIVQFRYPGRLLTREGRVSAPTVRPDALCVGHLDQAPLERNDAPCPDTRR